MSGEERAKLKHLDLFSGIGGFALGLGATDRFETVAFCESDLFCQHVLAEHWPGIPIYDDVRTLTSWSLQRAGVDRCDIITAGFPCQDVSWAGSRAGIQGARTGLWKYVGRLARDLGPRWIVLENVPNILGLGLGDLLGDLAEGGYDATWDCVPASALGAPHRRDRWWLIAWRPDADRRRCQGKRQPQHSDEQGAPWDLFDGLGAGGWWAGTHAPDTNCEGLPLPQQGELRRAWGRDEGGAAAERSWWAREPDVGRVAHGIPQRVDRLKSLGNSIVPQMATLVAEAILEGEDL
jgi:DNA (cytosine-5)-methyltransferase 1